MTRPGIEPRSPGLLVKYSYNCIGTAVACGCQLTDIHYIIYIVTLNSNLTLRDRHLGHCPLLRLLGRMCIAKGNLALDTP